MTFPEAGPMPGWRLPLRIARRDALRHRGRSLLVLAMIALPVLAVTAADVLMETSKVSGVESIDRRMGAAEALVTVQQGLDTVEQAPDPEQTFSTSSGTGKAPMLTADEVAIALDGGRLVEMRSNQVRVLTDKGAAYAEVTEVDLADPIAKGLFDLAAGRLPREAGEVVVNRALVEKGYPLGSILETVRGDVAGVVVGIAESTTIRNTPVAAGPLGSFGLDHESSRTWLVNGSPVTWRQVRELNAMGATVTSRAVITNPPPRSEWPESVRINSGRDEAMVAVIVLIVVMALIEVVLLAGPAFAVGARKQQRSLALMSATGGTPAQSRRVVISSALVLGGAAAVLGVALGVAVAWAGEPLLQGNPVPTSDRSTCRGCTCWGSPDSVCSVRSSPRSCRPSSLRARTSWQCSPAAGATGLPHSSRPCSG